MMNFYNLGRQVGTPGLAYRMDAMAGNLKMLMHTELKAMNAASERDDRVVSAVARGRALAYKDALEMLGILVKMDIYGDIETGFFLDDYCVDGEYVGLKARDDRRL